MGLSTRRRQRVPPVATLQPKGRSASDVLSMEGHICHPYLMMLIGMWGEWGYHEPKKRQQNQEFSANLPLAIGQVAQEMVRMDHRSPGHKAVAAEDRLLKQMDANGISGLTLGTLLNMSISSGIWFFQRLKINSKTNRFSQGVPSARNTTVLGTRNSNDMRQKHFQWEFQILKWRYCTI
jgi:hypothetical protein